VRRIDTFKTAFPAGTASGAFAIAAILLCTTDAACVADAAPFWQGLVGWQGGCARGRSGHRGRGAAHVNPPFCGVVPAFLGRSGHVLRSYYSLRLTVFCRFRRVTLGRTQVDPRPFAYLRPYAALLSCLSLQTSDHRIISCQLTRTPSRMLASWRLLVVMTTPDDGNSSPNSSVFRL
jgi:hypothetical protein